MLIAEGGIPVAEAGYRVGFSNAAAFTAAYRRHFGAPPRMDLASCGRQLKAGRESVPASPELCPAPHPICGQMWWEIGWPRDLSFKINAINRLTGAPYVNWVGACFGLDCYRQRITTKVFPRTRSHWHYNRFVGQCPKCGLRTHFLSAFILPWLAGNASGSVPKRLYGAH